MPSIKLGLLSPLSGIVEIYGKEIVLAAKIAVDEINEEGGLLGKKLELIVEDDGSLPDTAVPAAFKLIDEHKCSAIIGNLLSNSRISVSNFVSDVRKVPQLNFSFYEGGITSPYFFHFAALPNQQIDLMVPYMVKRFGSKIFFAGNNYEWPRGSIEAAKNVLKEIGGEIVGESYLPIGTTEEDIYKLIDNVSKSGADVFIPYFAGQDQINLLKIFTEYELKGKIAVVMGHYDEEMVQFLEPEVRDGFFSSNTYFMTIVNEQNEQLKRRLLLEPDVNGIWPQGNGVITNFSEGAYLCVKAFAQAVNNAQSLDTNLLIDALEQVKIRGPQGLVKMDKDTHHAYVNTYLSQCNKDGSFDIVESFGLIEPKVPKRYQLDNYQQLTSILDKSINSAVESNKNINNSMLDMVDVPILTTDYDGHIIYANKVMIELFGYSYDEFIGLSVHLLLPPALREIHKQHIDKFVKSDIVNLRMGERSEVVGYKKDGTYFSAEASISKVEIEGKKLLVATMIDITKEKESKERLQWQATHDSLTSLANRKLITQRLDSALERSKTNGNNVALLFIDIDNFKLINDTFGHDAGDELLIRVGQLITRAVGPGDIIGRLAGDEFVVISEKFDDTKVIELLAKRVNDSLRVPSIFHGQEVYTTASIGVVIGHGNTHLAEDMLRDSDAAMYLSKRHGKDNWNFFTDELHDSARREMEISNALRGALNKEEFTLLFQPIVSTETGAIKGAEALIRWNSSNLGFVSPDEFIPVSEKNGTIIILGKWIFEEACKFANELQTLYPIDTPYVSINVSTVQFNDTLFDDFMNIADRYNILPKNIVLEVTETSLMHDVNTSSDILNTFSSKGFSVAIDDFGTGYSSLLQLIKLPIHKIKIDKAFIDGLSVNNESKTIVTAITKMAKALNKKIIAEGVELDNQVFELQSLQVDYIQGYYFYKPMTRKQVLEKLVDNVCEKIKATNKVYKIIYVSKATKMFDMKNLNKIVEKSKYKNAQNGITGFLISSNNEFAQYLEGEEKEVKRLLKIVKNNRLHEQLTIVAEYNEKSRVFNEFSLGFWEIKRENNDEFKLWDLKDRPEFLKLIFEALAK